MKNLSKIDIVAWLLNWGLGHLFFASYLLSTCLTAMQPY